MSALTMVVNTLIENLPLLIDTSLQMSSLCSRSKIFMSAASSMSWQRNGFLM